MISYANQLVVSLRYSLIQPLTIFLFFISFLDSDPHLAFRRLSAKRTFSEFLHHSHIQKPTT